MSGVNRIIREAISLPSLAIRRFPLVILLLFALVITIIIAIATEDLREAELMTLILALPASFIWQLACEQKWAGRIVKIISGILLVVLLASYYLSLRSCFLQEEEGICTAMTFFGSIILLILLTAFLPFLKNRDNSQFLVFNRTIFIQWIISLFFAAIIFLGLFLALAAIDNLFEVKVDNKLYSYLGVFSFGLFMGIYFLSDIPIVPYSTEEEASAILKIFAQYIMIPIVALYGAILMVYAIQNIVNPRNNPEWTQWMILWFYIIGYLTYLLNLSLSIYTSHSWAKKFSKWFFYILVPMSLLILIGLYNSIQADGLTELKYIIATLSIYFLVIGIYLWTTAQPQYRFLPLLLALLTALSLYGPQSACEASIRSQTKHLKTQLLNTGYMDETGLIQGKNMSTDSYQKIRLSVNFLEDRSAIQPLKKWDTHDLLPDSINGNEFLDFLGDSVIPSDESAYYGYYQLPEIDLTDYQSLIYLDYHHYPEKIQSVDKIELRNSNDQLIGAFDLLPKEDLQRIEKDHMITLSNEEKKIDVYIQNAQVVRENELYRIQSIQGLALIRK